MWYNLGMKCPYKYFDKWFSDSICDITGYQCHHSWLWCPMLGDYKIGLDKLK